MAMNKEDLLCLLRCGWDVTSLETILEKMQANNEGESLDKDEATILEYTQRVVEFLNNKQNAEAQVLEMRTKAETALKAEAEANDDSDEHHYVHSDVELNLEQAKSMREVAIQELQLVTAKMDDCIHQLDEAYRNLLLFVIGNSHNLPVDKDVLTAVIENDFFLKNKALLLPELKLQLFQLVKNGNMDNESLKAMLIKVISAEYNDIGLNISDLFAPKVIVSRLQSEQLQTNNPLYSSIMSSNGSMPEHNQYPDVSTSSILRERQIGISDRTPFMQAIRFIDENQQGQSSTWNNLLNRYQSEPYAPLSQYMSSEVCEAEPSIVQQSSILSRPFIIPKLSIDAKNTILNYLNNPNLGVAELLLKASDPCVDQDILIRVLNHPNKNVEVLKAVANNPSADGSVLQALSLVVAAEDSSTQELYNDLLLLLVRKPQIDLDTYANILNNAADNVLLLTFIDNSNKDLLIKLAASPNMSKQTAMVILSRCNDAKILHNLFYNSNCFCDQKAERVNLSEDIINALLYKKFGFLELEIKQILRQYLMLFNNNQTFIQTNNIPLYDVIEVLMPMAVKSILGKFDDNHLPNVKNAAQAALVKAMGGDILQDFVNHFSLPSNSSSDNKTSLGRLMRQDPKMREDRCLKMKI